MSQPDRDLGPLFERMRAEDAAPRTPEEEAALEARIVARIDEVVANDPVPPRAQSAPRPRVPAPVRIVRPPPSRMPARVAMWLVAACLPLVVYAAYRARAHEPAAQIERDPIASGSPIVAPPVHPLDPSSPDPSPDPVRSPSPDPPAPALPARATPSVPASPSPLPTAVVGKPLAAPPEGDDALGAPSGSTLSAENRLFEEGTRAEREGNVEAALAALDRLARDFPRSPLAQNAMVRRFHLLARAGRKSEAVDAARAYLAAYPQGFAQREADEIVRGAAPSETPLPERE